MYNYTNHRRRNHQESDKNMKELLHMSQIEKYQGIIPAFYACYDEAGAISPERVRALTEYFIQKGVKGL